MTDIDIFLKYKDKDVRFPEVRTSFLMELEPLVIGRTIKHYNYLNKVFTYQILELDDVFDYDGENDDSGLLSIPGRYVVATLHYFTPTRNLEKFRTVRLLITKNGLECKC